MSLIVLALGLVVIVGGIAACVLLSGRDHRARVTRQHEYHQSLYAAQLRRANRGTEAHEWDVPEVAAFLAATDYERAREADR